MVDSEVGKQVIAMKRKRRPPLRSPLFVWPKCFGGKPHLLITDAVELRSDAQRFRGLEYARPSRAAHAGGFISVSAIHCARTEEFKGVRQGFWWTGKGDFHIAAHNFNLGND